MKVLRINAILPFKKPNEIVVLRYANIGVNFLSNICFIKAFGLEQFGTLAFNLAILHVLNSTGSFGASLTVTRKFSHTHHHKIDEKEYFSHLNCYLLIQLIVSFTLALAAFSYYQIFSDLDTNAIVLFSATIIVGSFVEFSINYFRAKKRFKLYYLLGTPSLMLLILIFYAVFTLVLQKAHQNSIIYAIFFAYFFIFLICALKFFKDFRFVSLPTPKLLLNVFRQETTALLSVLQNTLTYNLEVFIAKILYGETIAGLARITFQLFNLATIPISTVNIQNHNQIHRILKRKVSLLLFKSLQLKYLKSFFYGFLPFCGYLIAITGDVSYQFQLAASLLISCGFLIEVYLGPTNLFVHLLNKSHLLLLGSMFSLIIRITIALMPMFTSLPPEYFIVVAISLSNSLTKLVTRLGVRYG